VGENIVDWQARIDDLKKKIRDVPDFPKPGIVFKDITPLLGDAVALRRATDMLVVLCDDRSVDKVAGIESRGFILASIVATRLGVGFVPVRKPGKLPAKTVAASYELEYGTDSLEVHADAISAGERVLIVDDVIATGGTAQAAADLVEKLGGEVSAYAFLVELAFLNGRERLAGHDVLSLIEY
jgi:adenine phosphoribosyltransferase